MYALGLTDQQIAKIQIIDAKQGPVCCWNPVAPKHDCFWIEGWFLEKATGTVWYEWAQGYGESWDCGFEGIDKLGNPTELLKERPLWWTDLVEIEIDSYPELSTKEHAEELINLIVKKFLI